MSILRVFAGLVRDWMDPRYWTDGSFSRSTLQAGVQVNESTVLGLPAYYAGLRAISEDVGKLPFPVYRRRARAKERDYTHPVYALLNRAPNPQMGAATFREMIQHWALGWGNGYAQITRRLDGTPERLSPMPPAAVRPFLRDSELLYEVTLADGKKENLPQKEVFHLRGLGCGLAGYSLLDMAAESMGLALAAQRSAAAFYANGTRLSGVLTAPRKPGDDELAEIRRHWKALYGGPTATGETAVLWGGMDFRPLSIPPKQAQFLESRMFAIEEVARWLRMSPHKLQHLIKATFNNMEYLSIDYVVDTLLSWTIRWEQEVDTKLIDDPEYYAEHLFEGLLRGDSQSRAVFYKAMFEIGAMSPNDIRERENLNPAEGGDVYYVPANMVPAGTRAEDSQDDQQLDGEELEQRSPIVPARYPGVERVGLAIGEVLEDVGARILRREEGAARKAARRCPDGDAFSAWAREFYGAHLGWITDALAPSLRAASRMTGVDLAVLESRAVEVAEKHCSRSIEILRGAYRSGGAGAVEVVTGQWGRRPGDLAREIGNTIPEPEANDATLSTM